MRLERLLNVLKRETKKLVESIGKSGIFYATALKTLKRDFGNVFTVAHMKTKLLFNKPQLKHNDQISLKDFPQQLKCHITWLKSMGYQSVLKSPEYLIKAVGRLPNCLGERFYKSARNIVNCEDFLSLQQFQIWLENRVKEQYNPIANILASDKSYKNRDNPTRSNNFSNKNSNTDREIKCWLCENKLKITSCDQFKAKSLSEKIRFVEQGKLCWN